jgi:hypothetical protein
MEGYKGTISSYRWRIKRILRCIPIRSVHGSSALRAAFPWNDPDSFALLETSRAASTRNLKTGSAAKPSSRSEGM